MLYTTARDWREAPNKRVAVFGMSGLGKTYISNMLRETGSWFHYSVDFRIGTRYMGEHIVDNFKREAMQNRFLRDLLMSDSIYIASNITFNNLSPLSTYLGKPGNPDLGGIGFEDYVQRQRQHREAEIAATRDAAVFARKAAEIYGYPHFVADTSGSLCEVVSPDDPDDPVLSTLSQAALPIWIEGDDSHIETLVARFLKAPKPMYYNEAFLRGIWAQYLAEHDQTEEDVDPDAFICWGYRQLLIKRLPLYSAMARNWGLTIKAADLAKVRDAQDFVACVADHLPG